MRLKCSGGGVRVAAGECVGVGSGVVGCGNQCQCRISVVATRQAAHLRTRATNVGGQSSVPAARSPSGAAPRCRTAPTAVGTAPAGTDAAVAARPQPHRHAHGRRRARGRGRRHSSLSHSHHHHHHHHHQHHHHHRDHQHHRHQHRSRCQQLWKCRSPRPPAGTVPRSAETP